MNESLRKEYREHTVFGQLSEYAEFYRSLSFSIMSWLSQGTKAVINIDTYVYSSMQGTLESINDVLLKGRINDSYALLRKYYDSTIINIYSNLYLEDHFNINNFIVSQIDNWRKGTDKLPEYRIMSNYIKSSQKLQAITILLQKDNTYKNIRDRCNDHTHYNYYHNLLSNDNEIYLQDRLKSLDAFSKDLENIFIQHFSYVFYLHDHYMMSSDYRDSMELGLIPEEGAQYFVAPFIQNIFSNIIKTKRPDLANEIKNNTAMMLE
ncbi:MAG: hypothetical protein WDA22_16880 [Bacteroidota bacterium]